MDMDEQTHQIYPDGSLVHEVTIKKIKPCVVAEGKVRVLMQLDAGLEEIIPKLVTNYPPGKVNYIQNKKILTLNLFKRLITLYPSGKVSMNKTLDADDALEVMKSLMKDINESYLQVQEGESIDEISKKLAKLGPLNIYNCLPQTNCQECGEATCMAFAIQLLAGESSLDKCSPLKDDNDIEKIKCLEKILGSQLFKTMGGNLLMVD
jgi:ArsR family metal-binding transcriptional regulator